MRCNDDDEVAVAVAGAGGRWIGRTIGMVGGRWAIGGADCRRACARAGGVMMVNGGRALRRVWVHAAQAAVRERRDERR